MSLRTGEPAFLSIQAQDFIEDRRPRTMLQPTLHIPEHSSSGLH